MNRTPPSLMIESDEIFSQGSVRMLPDWVTAARLRAQNAWRVFDRDPQLALERLQKLQRYLHVFHTKACEGDCQHSLAVHLQHEELERRLYRPIQDAVRFLERAIQEGTTTGGAKQRLRSALKFLETERELKDMCDQVDDETSVS